MNKQTALITGAGGGIGQALCSAFRDAGWCVIGTDKTSKIDAPVDVYIAMDLERLCRDEIYRDKKLASVRSELPTGGLKVLINNAAVQIVKPVDQLRENDWHETMDVNLIAPCILINALLQKLEKAKGSVINIASIHASLTKPGFSAYATSKAALVGLSRSLAVELGNRLRINAICPGAIETPMLMEGLKENEGAYLKLKRMHPIGRLGYPNEIAKLALFLVSDAASFITGAAIAVDGGIGVRLHDPA